MLFKGKVPESNAVSIQRALDYRRWCWCKFFMFVVAYITTVGFALWQMQLEYGIIF